MPQAGLIQQCLEKSTALLQRNLTAEGIMAAAPSERAESRRYTRIFGRDAAICALGMAVSGSEELLRGAKAGIETLAAHQADNGQIPKYVDPAHQESDFWYLGCIDATLWWLIAVKFLYREPPPSLSSPVQKALRWAHCQEHPRLFLLQQNEASDWADIMPRSGFVLYTNALWYFVKRLYGLPHAEDTRFHFNHLFYPFSREMPDYRRLRLLTHFVRTRSRRTDLYASFVNFSFWGEEGDVFGNLLAILLGLANDAPAHRIMHELKDASVVQPWPVRAVCRPIQEDSSLWRGYMGRHRQNLAFQYHNGGCWPFIGGFWIMVLAALGKHADAKDVLFHLARANEINDWEFNEWFHGEDGTPLGMPGQSWNAAMFLLAHHSLTRNVFSLPFGIDTSARAGLISQ